MGDCAEFFIFPRGVFLFSKAAVFMDGALRKFCGVDYRGVCSSVAA